jgi:hypothetical protein
LLSSGIAKLLHNQKRVITRQRINTQMIQKEEEEAEEATTVEDSNN